MSAFEQEAEALGLQRQVMGTADRISDLASGINPDYAFGIGPRVAARGQAHVGPADILRREAERMARQAAEMDLQVEQMKTAAATLRERSAQFMAASLRLANDAA